MSVSALREECERVRELIIFADTRSDEVRIHNLSNLNQSFEYILRLLLVSVTSNEVSVFLIDDLVVGDVSMMLTSCGNIKTLRLAVLSG